MGNNVGSTKWRADLLWVRLSDGQRFPWIVRHPDGALRGFETLASKNGDVVDELFDVARELCGMTAADVDEEGKDSEEAPSA